MIRIVKMTFQPDRADEFIGMFNEMKAGIAAFEGCEKVELYRDKKLPNVFFTYSIWEDENYLNAYRTSEFFQNNWTRTKQFFADKPEAWSVEDVG